MQLNRRWIPRGRYARHKQGRRGFAFVFVILLMVVIFGFTSLAVDLGVAQMAKTQLQNTVDAAARSACKGMATSYTQAQTDAIASAAYNTVNGSGYTLSSADIDFGTWDTTNRTFTVLTGAAR